ncbi:amino acid synthesis family protein [Streptomyces carpinensis]|uniref:Amino acid synthesis family protein n=1 Tax=Streptomyces carpinensis TaxID=66369 RepID=A0ABV1VX57_9ACTN
MAGGLSPTSGRSRPAHRLRAATGSLTRNFNAAVTSTFGDALRKAIGGGEAWISPVTEASGTDATIDVPLAFKDEIWVRSHYDAIAAHLPDVPAPRRARKVRMVSCSRSGGRDARAAPPGGGALIRRRAPVPSTAARSAPVG